VHTNPILICFCSILYYPELGEFVRRYKIERKILLSRYAKQTETEKIKKAHVRINEFSGRLSFSDEIFKPKVKSKSYKTRCIIRWRLLVILNWNKELISLRKHHLVKDVKKENKEEGMMNKLKRMLNCTQNENVVAPSTSQET
jgi:hypothetical protein